jgi:hypothetical protein
MTTECVLSARGENGMIEFVIKDLKRVPLARSQKNKFNIDVIVRVKKPNSNQTSIGRIVAFSNFNKTPFYSIYIFNRKKIIESVPEKAISEYNDTAK